MNKLLSVIYGALSGIISFMLDRWSILGGVITLSAYCLLFGVTTLGLTTLPFMAAAFTLGALLGGSLISLTSLIYNRATKEQRETRINSTFINYNANPIYAGFIASHQYFNQLERSPLASAIHDGMTQSNKIHHLYGHKNVPGVLNLELMTKPSSFDSKATKLIRFIRGG